MTNNKPAIMVFVLPTLLFFTLFVFVPVLMTVYYSLLEWDSINPSVFIGIGNFIELFGSREFATSIRNSFVLVAMSIFIQLPLAMFLSLSLNRGIGREGIYRSLFFIPVILPSVVIGNLWLRIYNPNYGILNSFLRTIGLESLASPWLGDIRTAIYCVFIPLVWQYIGYYMLLFYSALKSISTDVIEAAKLDGASFLQLDWHINIPMIIPMIRVCLVFAAVGSLKTFDLIYIMTNGAPAGATEILATYMYKGIFSRNRYGYGSAIALWLIILCFLFTYIIDRLVRKIEQKNI
ncbi:MAG: sugar ABC transporter permease [Treponema sp.]|jgi:raffinose/stachyose/melibiose transport system permease protein|nr:sugar ABC transporter permease [Treponema sp.]